MINGRFGNLALLYDEIGRVLRIESTCNDVGACHYKFGIAVEMEKEIMIYITAAWETRPFCYFLIIRKK